MNILKNYTMRQIAFKTFGDIYGFDHEFMDTSYPMRPLWEEKDNNLTLEIVLPGAENKDIKVERVDDKLVVSFEGNDYGAPFSYEYMASKEILKGNTSFKCEKGILTILIKKQKADREVIKAD